MRTFCRRAKKTLSCNSSAGTKLAPQPRRQKQRIDIKGLFRLAYTLHTGGVTGSIPVAPTIARGDYDRRVAQWQSAPITWERSGVRFLFAPTTAAAQSLLEK